MSNNKDKKHEEEVNPHREHQLYSWYADDLLAHAEATKVEAAKQRQEKGIDEGRK